MHDLCRDRKVVRIHQDVSRVLEGCEQLQCLVQRDPHPLGWFRRPGAAHRWATDWSGTRERMNGRWQVGVTWPDDSAGERLGRRRFNSGRVTTVPTDDEGRAPCP